MGIAVSGWQLAAAVSREGQFGVVSGTALALSLARHLQLGHFSPYLREAFSAFPVPKIAQRVLDRWGLKDAAAPVSAMEPVPMPSWPMSPELLDLMVLGAFAEIYLAKHYGGSGPIGVNLLTKVELPTLASLYGAMLAGVDAVFMGAGIPRQIPGILDAFAKGLDASLPLTVENSSPEVMTFSPSGYLQQPAPELRRPAFFPIVSSDVLATILLRKSNGQIDGFVVEDHTAGGHNAPPRRNRDLNTRGEPVWTDSDRPSLGAFRKLGLPFYLAGGQSDALSLRAVQAQGATGVQLGTAFAFCDESGIRAQIKQSVLRAVSQGEIDLLTDPMASPTGFPFKVVQMSGTLSETMVYDTRARTCDIGYLRTAYRRPDGQIAFRCPAERSAAYVSKGGEEKDLLGRKCLCAGLAAASNLQLAEDGPCIITAGQSIRQLAQFLRPGADHYSAADVIRVLLQRA